MTKKTLRLTFPQWQGGINPPYYEGSHILDWLAPKNDSMKCAKVPVKTNFDDEVPVTDGIAWKEELLEQQKAAYAICEEKDPDRTSCWVATARWSRLLLTTCMGNIRKIRP